LTGLVYATAATALAIVAVFAGYLISHLKSKVARLEHAQSELVRRGNLSNEKSRQYQNTLSGVLASLPIPSAIIDVRDRSIVAESECLTKQLQSLSTARISEPAFSTCFFSEDRYPHFLPVLRNLLKQQKLRSGVYSDHLSLVSGLSSQNSGFTNVTATISIHEPLVYIEFEFPDRVKDRESQSNQDNRILRSILNEVRLDRAFERASTLLHEPLGNELLCSVSVVDPDLRALKLVWQKGLEGVIKSLITQVPMVFGDTPTATASILEKTVIAGSGNEEHSEVDLAQLPEQVHAWHSHPIKSVDGRVLGTLDLITLSEGVDFPDEECIANFLFIASVIFERRHALGTIVRQARVDQLTKEIGQRLLMPEGRSRFEVLSSCLLFLATASELSKGKVGLVYECPNERIELMGDFFGNQCQRGCQNELDLDAIKDLFIKGQQAWVAGSERGMEVTLIEPGSYWAQMIARVFPVSEDMKKASLILCPIVLNDDLAGALIFGSETECNETQRSLLTMLTPGITNYLIREALLEELESRANHDQLTGLYNRGCIEERLKAEIERSRRYKNDLSVILFDIDHFKAINDSFGHDVGDEVLKGVASRVESSLRTVDMMGRWGGEEFLVILAETDSQSARHVAENLRRLVEADVYQTSRPVTVSAGIASFSEGDDAASLIKRADIALYGAKNEGRNRVRAG
jgi:diguanylate cyclase (GGDEF)-like protein